MTSVDLQVREKVRKSKGIDYNAEVAFEHRAAPGFYDTGAEQAQTRIQGQEFRPQTVEEIEGRRPRVHLLTHTRLHAEIRSNYTRIISTPDWNNVPPSV